MSVVALVFIASGVKAETRSALRADVAMFAPQPQVERYLADPNETYDVYGQEFPTYCSIDFLPDFVFHRFGFHEDPSAQTSQEDNSFYIIVWERSDIAFIFRDAGTIELPDGKIYVTDLLNKSAFRDYIHEQIRQANCLPDYLKLQEEYLESN